VRTHPHAVKLAWLELFGTWVGLDGLDRGQPTVVAGDLNVAPTDADVWDPDRYRSRNLTSPTERKAFEDLLGRGLVDVVRQSLGPEPAFTWWNRRSDFFATDRGWRLDHVLADPATAAGTRTVMVDRDERAEPDSSDHAPIVVDFGLDLG
jgi:exodeoxyribonuclease-3